MVFPRLSFSSDKSKRVISHPINQPEVTCGRQKPRFGRSRFCRSRSRSQRSLHSPLHGGFAVALTHVTSHDQTQETYGSFENSWVGRKPPRAEDTVPVRLSRAGFEPFPPGIASLFSRS